MITLAALCFIIGILPYMLANSASVNYEPIKITVNENFNMPPGRVSQGLTSVNPSFFHQGANFYFNPQLMLPPGYISSQIETLISSIKQKTESFSKVTPLEIVVEKNKISETIKPLGDSVSEFVKETLSGIVVEKENVTEVIKPLPELPATLEKENMMEDIEITEVSMPIPTEVIVMEKIEAPLPPPSIIIDEDSKPDNQELLVILETNVLPPLSFDVIPPDIVEEVKIEEPILLEESIEVFPPIPEISTRPILEPIGVPEFTIVEENVDVPPPPPPIIIDEEPKPVNQELVVISEAPVLPPLSFDVIPPDVVEEVKIEEPILLEESMEVFPPIREISTGPMLEPIRVHEFTFVEENLNKPPLPPPIIIDEEPKPVNHELAVIPDALVLPPLSFDVIPPDLVEEVKIEEPILFEESMEVFPPIREISTAPILEPIGVHEFTIVEDNPNMPPLPLPIIIDEEPKPVNEQLVAIPEAPVLPPLSFDVIPPDLVEEVKIEEPILFEESMEVFPPIREISTGPILEPIGVHEFTIVEENLDMPLPSPPIIIDEEPKPINEELVVIPEAPVFSPLSFDSIPPNVVDEVKIEEPILFEESMKVFPPIREISTGSIIEPIRVPEFIFIEENLYMSPPLPPIIIDEEPNSVNQELVGIPKAPVFPPLDDIPAALTEEVKIEEPILLEESIKEFPTISEISTGPIQQPIIVPEIPDSFESEEISEPALCAECVFSIKENIPPIIIPEHKKALGTFKYLPMMKRKDFVNPKFKENIFLGSINKQPLRFPQFLFNNLLSKLILNSKPKEKDQFLYSTSRERNIVEKRIAPNAIYKRKSSKKIDIRSGFPKGPSKIKYLRL